MTRTLNKKAWAILVEDERTALVLNFGHDKSSWQAGEQLGKSHYKYLEIQYRAKHFLKIFTEHFEVFDEVIPTYVTGNAEVKDYFRLCIGQRLKLHEVHTKLDEKHGYSGKKYRATEIIHQMEVWYKSNDGISLAIYNLIKDFDRWNNFRILPAEIQEPSAFKRRTKNIHKKHIKVTASVPDISLPLMEKLWGAKPRSKHKKIYLPVITVTNNTHILIVRDVPDVRKAVDPLNLYLFKDKATAQEYIALLKSYLIKEVKQCKDGLEFWPSYREIIKLAINYEQIQKIVPMRRHLELALRKLSFI